MADHSTSPLDLHFGNEDTLSEKKELLEYSPIAEMHVETIQPGMVILRNALTPKRQQAIVDECQEWGIGDGGFYRPVYRSGAKCRLYMMCLGRHWNVKTEEYEYTRTNYDNAPVIPFPTSEFTTETQQFINTAFQVDPLVLGTCSTTYNPDICVVNYYSHSGRNGLHRDKDESAEAMEKGSPVVSYSIGCEADFAYCDAYPADKQTTVPVVRLHSGDVLIFGGPSRNVVHALTRLYSNTAPPYLRMRKGRLNLTFREFCPP